MRCMFFREQRQHQRRQPRDAGFTLLELLLAVSFSAVVLMSAHSVVQTALMVERTAGDRFDEAQIARTLSRQFLRDVESARYDPGDSSTASSGDATTLTLATVSPVPVGGSEVVDQWVVTYTCDAEAKGLVRTQVPLLGVPRTAGALASPAGAPEFAPGGRSQEYDQVAARLEYLDGTSWVAQWTGPELPAAVKIVYCASGELGKGRDHSVLARPAV